MFILYIITQDLIEKHPFWNIYVSHGSHLISGDVMWYSFHF